MKKLLFTIFCITQIGFILVYPTETLKAAREGLNLWLNVMIPTLLPFLICTGILVQTDQIPGQYLAVERQELQNRYAIPNAFQAYYQKLMEVLA